MMHCCTLSSFPIIVVITFLRLVLTLNWATLRGFRRFLSFIVTNNAYEWEFVL